MNWDEAELQRHIADQIEESLTLDYKAAGALDRTNEKKTEITKDVSAMANSAGGTVIYGIRERPRPNKHLPERIDPIDRAQFSKEWLEQIINQIRPRLDGVIINPITLSSAPVDVAYVVEIPQGSTAHQALDHKYYKRFNFESVPMEDHEIRDVMNRQTKAEADVIFTFKRHMRLGGQTQFMLLPIVRNLGGTVINNYKLKIVFPHAAADLCQVHFNRPDFVTSRNENQDYVLEYQSTGVLFPGDERNVGELMQWLYAMDEERRTAVRLKEVEGNEMVLLWTLYADDMAPKQGTIPVRHLHDL